jgi:hypothetical protein
LEAPIPAHFQTCDAPLPTIDECLGCIPDPRCRPFVSTVLKQLAARVHGDMYISPDDVAATLSKSGLAAAKAVLLNLVPAFSAEITLPRAAIPFVRKRLARIKLTLHETREFQDIAPEVFELLDCVDKVGNKAAVVQSHAFLEGLAGIVEAREYVIPPPWELIPETYNPPKRGMPPHPPPISPVFNRIIILCELNVFSLFMQDSLSILLTRACKGVIRRATPMPYLTARTLQVRVLTSSSVDDGKRVVFLIGFVLMGSATVQV